MVRHSLPPAVQVAPTPMGFGAPQLKASSDASAAAPPLPPLPALPPAPPPLSLLLLLLQATADSARTRAAAKVRFMRDSLRLLPPGCHYSRGHERAAERRQGDPPPFPVPASIRR